MIALDADNTLWGGIIGEDGINGIALGPDYPGNAYVAFQRRLLDYQQRGFVLALCSKNNPADLDQVLDQHPHQVLRNEHFAARRVNWEAKPRNLVSLAKELNLGLNSFVFVDDSDHECAAVRHELPEVEVVQAPRNPVHLASCLDRLPRLEILSLTAEDRAKTQLYAQERKRREQLADISGGGGDLDEYLRSLDMRMRVSFDDTTQLARLAQLTQKTNQFNLTTRRYQEPQVQEFIESPDYLVAHFSLADAFGDSGVVGLAIARKLPDDRAEIDTFLMSCRVIGRRAETAFLEAVLERLASEGVTEVVADFLPTSKNAPASGFLAESGFEQRQDGRFVRSLKESPPGSGKTPPISVEIDDTGASGLSSGLPRSLRPIRFLRSDRIGMSTFEELREAIAQTLEIPPEVITTTSTAEDVAGWDSLGHVNLMMSIEQTFDVQLDVEDFPKLTSVPAILEYLKGQGIA